MLDLVSACSFAGFLLLVARVALSERRPEVQRRRAVSALILYCVGVSLAAGLTQHDAWPFAKWPMAGGPADADGENTRVVGLDAAGGEHSIDARAWQPLGFDELNPWMHRTFPRLPRPAQEGVAAFLLDLAEGARQRARSGRGVGYQGRLLGPLTAPDFDLHPRVWSAAAAPAQPLTGLRVYRERWNQEQRRRDPTRMERALVFEYVRR